MATFFCRLARGAVDRLAFHALFQISFWFGFAPAAYAQRPLRESRARSQQFRRDRQTLSTRIRKLCSIRRYAARGAPWVVSDFWERSRTPKKANPALGPGFLVVQVE
jgi:hypothetical protein